jgi:hypothetical protein
MSFFGAYEVFMRPLQMLTNVPILRKNTASVDTCGFPVAAGAALESRCNRKKDSAVITLTLADFPCCLWNTESET